MAKVFFKMSGRMMDASEAYDAMFLFIERYWERGGKTSEDLAVLLTNMDRGRDKGLPLDQAQWYDWLEVCDKILQSSERD